MPWNEPGSGNSGNQDKDPWGSGNRNRGNQGPDLEEIINNVRKRFGGGGNSGRSRKSGGGFGVGGFSPLLILLVLGIVAWGFQAFYTVQEGYESIELRFGKYRQTVGAGLQFVWWPIEDKVIINSKNIRTAEIGFRKDTGTSRGSVPQEAQMLTTDENIADVSLAVQYNISNVEDLYFNVGSLEANAYVDYVVDSVVRGATESALREVVGSTTMDDLFNKGRSVVETRTSDLVQRILDRYQTGINVVAVEMQAALPPIEVREAFDNVNKADQLEQQLMKEARAYEEKVVLEAQGQAARMIAEANGYKEAVIARSSGESERFSRILAEYQKAPEVTRKRLYLETMEQVLGNSNKVMIDQEGGNNMMYLPLDQIMQNRQRTNNAGSSGSVNSSSNSTVNSANSIREPR
ncbi:MAG: FtsH protease activity modulator HflK [Acidiferrobacterales bacterium]|nr:FtsH protease activity modulator HflK [Acidiferrobacterales bacterium]